MRAERGCFAGEGDEHALGDIMREMRIDARLPLRHPVHDSAVPPDEFAKCLL